MPVTKRRLLALLGASLATDAAAADASPPNPTSLGRRGPAAWNVVDLAPGIDIMDGASHPLHRSFPNLAAATAAFPRVTSPVQMGDEMCFHAHQRAFDLAAAGGGGRVATPRGMGLMGANTLEVPDSPRGDDADDQVVWEGQGDRNTVLFWHRDVPGKAYCMGHRTRHSYSRFTMRDIHLRGPAQAVPLGQEPCRLIGPALSAGWRLERVTASHFLAAVSVVDDHTAHLDCTYGRGCFYGVLWDDATIDFGDHLFLRTGIGQCLMACHGVSPTNQIEHSLFIDCHHGFSPFVVHRRARRPGEKVLPLMSNTRFVKAQAEQCGNGYVYSECETDPADHITKTAFEDIQFFFNDKYRIDRLPKAPFRVGAMTANTFQGPHTAFGAVFDTARQIAPGYGWFNCRTAFQSNVFNGGYFDLLTSSSAGTPLVRSPVCLFNRAIGGEQFDCDIVQSTGDVGAGDLVAADGLSARRREAGDAVLGVAAVACRAGDSVTVVTRGFAAIRKTAQAVRRNQALVADDAQPAAVSPANAPQRAGVVARAFEGASASDATVRADLRT